MKNTPIVQLGFSEPRRKSSSIGHESPNWKTWDGGKIGGKPSWLNPRDLPKAPLRCRQCMDRDGTNNGTILRFIAQLYSPADEDTDNIHAYHRSIYVFACPHPLCSLPSTQQDTPNGLFKSVAVLRCQLPRINEFYSEDGSSGSLNKHTSEYWKVNLCFVCGQRAVGQCPKTKMWFCCKEHQIEYSKLNKTEHHVNSGVFESIFHESELVVENEPPEDSMTEEDLQRVLQSSMFINEEQEQEEDDDKYKTWNQDDLNQITGVGDGGVTDTTTIEFYTRIGRAHGHVKGQCLRYCRWPNPGEPLPHIPNDINDDDNEDTPLWLSSFNRPLNKDIQHCEYCGAERRFEFQIMPQMLHFLLQRHKLKESNINPTLKDTMLAAAHIVDRATEEGLELDIPNEIQRAHDDMKERMKRELIESKGPMALDWGVISVYTCVNSCGGVVSSGDVAYTQEFAWRQPPLSYDK